MLDLRRVISRYFVAKTRTVAPQLCMLDTDVLTQTCQCERQQVQWIQRLIDALY